MKKKYFNIVICCIILLFLIELFNHSHLVIMIVFQSINIWFYNIIPTILPIYLIVDLFTNYQGIYYLSNLFGKFMEKVFKMKKETSYIFLLSLISGFPSNSKYIKTMMDKKIINVEEANKLLTFTHFSNPLFIIETIGVTFLNNKKIGILILFIHYFTNIIIGLFYRNYYIDLNNKRFDELKKDNFITCLTNSIYQTIKLLFLLLGIITFFMLITSIIKMNIGVNNLVTNIFCGLLEMTQGIYYIDKINISLRLKASIITFFISFGGLSIHLQVFSILNKYKLSYSNYFLARIMHGLIASSLIYLIISLIPF